MRSSPFDLAGSVAIVTGASSGLGARFARVLTAAGASVVVAARRLERLQALQAELPRARAVACDVPSPADREHLVATTVEQFGHVDVLVNNAGTTGPSVPAEDEDATRWEHTIAVNLTAVFALSQLVGQHMLDRRSGSIIQVASAFGLVASVPFMDAAYSASKGRVVNLTRELAAEWAPRGVRVNALAPGWFPSELTQDMIDDEASQRYIRRGCPMQRMGQEHELDGALLFLASGASSYCTGQTLSVDGGWTIR